MTPYLRIRNPKTQGIEGNRPLRTEYIREYKSRGDRFGQVFCLRHRGFDRVSTGCRVGDRVGPKGGRR